MISEYQFNDILLNNSIINIKKPYFIHFKSSLLKSLINNIYENYNLPLESFTIALYYIFKCINTRSNFIELFLNNNYQNSVHKENINNYIFVSIILANKQLLDFELPITDMCNMCNINYNTYCEIELNILKTLNWNTFYISSDFDEFKNLLVHHKDLLHNHYF